MISFLYLELQEDILLNNNDAMKSTIYLKDCYVFNRNEKKVAHSHKPQSMLVTLGLYSHFIHHSLLTKKTLLHILSSVCQMKELSSSKHFKYNIFCH